MNQPAALRPLVEAADAIRRLDDPDSTHELAAATLAVVDAIEQSLRLRLQDRATDLPFDELVKSLRTRGLISLEAAGTVHEARAAGDRAAKGAMRDGDTDRVKAAVRRLQSEFGQADAAHESAGPDVPAPAGEGDTTDGSTDIEKPAVASLYESRWMRWLAAALAASVILGALWVGSRGGGQEYDDALAAFRAGRVDSAAAGFERVLEEQPGDVTAMLYLARSYRRMDRPEEAAGALRRAVGVDPEDGDVRRELGHLFMDLDRPVSALAQYEQAVEYEPEEPLNWAALVRVLRRLEDPRADRLLSEAPAEVQAALGGA